MKIIGGLITKNAEWFLKESVESYIDFVDKLVVIDDYSTDNTCDILSSFGKKVNIIQKEFHRDKVKQRQAYVDAADKGDFIFCPDSDEVFTIENINTIEQAVKEGKLTVAIQHINFWKTYNNVIRGEVWDQFHQRGFKKLANTFYSDLHYSVNIGTVNYFKFAQTKDLAYAYRDRLRIHHYGYMKPSDQVYDKVAYYMRRDNPNCRKNDGTIDEQLVKEYTSRHPFFSGNFNHPRYGSGGLFCCGTVGAKTDTITHYGHPHPLSVRKRTDYKARGGIG